MRPASDAGAACRVGVREEPDALASELRQSVGRDGETRAEHGDGGGIIGTLLHGDEMMRGEKIWTAFAKQENRERSGLSCA